MRTIRQFTDLAWTDLREWAGQRVVGRGKSYVSAVEDLRRIENGLLAWVRGRRRYATLVRLETGGSLAGGCSCPYSWGPCKHMVAIILSYLEAVQSVRSVPEAGPEDERLALAEEAADEDDDILADAGEEDMRRLRGYLDGLTKKELANILLEGRDRVPELSRQLRDREEMENGGVERLKKSIRREIREVSEEPAGRNYWRDREEGPDYSGVRSRLRNLLAAGEADAVVELGEYLMRRGEEQVGLSGNDGAIGMAIGSCMEVVFQAAGRSSMTNAQRLLWEFDIRKGDDYDILAGVEGFWDKGSGFGKSDWSEAADGLFARLDKLPRGGRNFMPRYKREQVLRWLVAALDRAGRGGEVVGLLEREMAPTGCYVELVDRLVAEKKKDAAREWARRGIKELGDSQPGTVGQLRDRLRDLAARARNYPQAAAYRALEYFDFPDSGSYRRLKKAAGKAGVWERIRGPVLKYLETGRRPDLAGEDDSAWPLPRVEQPEKTKSPRGRGGSDIETIIEIALLEGRHDDALNWRRRRGRTGFSGGGHSDAQIARAVQKTDPEAAVEIWQGLVASEIARSKPAAYRAAGGYLKQIRAVLLRTGGETRWSKYLADLRDANRRRPRLLEVLDSLEGRRTPIVRGKPIRKHRLSGGGRERTPK